MKTFHIPTFDSEGNLIDSSSESLLAEPEGAAFVEAVWETIAALFESENTGAVLEEGLVRPTAGTSDQRNLRRTK